MYFDHGQEKSFPVLSHVSHSKDILGSFPEVQTDSIHIMCYVLLVWVTPALSFQAEFLILCLWSSLLFLHELASPLLASLWVLLKPFPDCSGDGLMNNSSQDINFYDVNVRGGYCDIIILDSV